MPESIFASSEKVLCWRECWLSSLTNCLITDGGFEGFTDVSWILLQHCESEVKHIPEFRLLTRHYEYISYRVLWSSPMVTFLEVVVEV